MKINVGSASGGGTVWTEKQSSQLEVLFSTLSVYEPCVTPIALGGAMLSASTLPREPVGGENGEALCDSISQTVIPSISQSLG